MDKSFRKNNEINLIEGAGTPDTFSDYNIKKINLQEYKNIFDTIEDSKKFQNSKDINKSKVN